MVTSVLEAVSRASGSRFIAIISNAREHLAGEKPAVLSRLMSISIDRFLDLQVTIDIIPSDSDLKQILVLVTRSLYAQLTERLRREDAASLGLLLTGRFLLEARALEPREFRFLLELGSNLDTASSILGDQAAAPAPSAQISVGEAEEDDERTRGAQAILKAVGKPILDQVKGTPMCDLAPFPPPPTRGGWSRARSHRGRCTGSLRR